MNFLLNLFKRKTAKNIFEECDALYKATMKEFWSSLDANKNIDQEYSAFLQKHFIKMNNLVASCNCLTSVGYSDEANIIARTMLEKLVDFMEIYKDEKDENHIVLIKGIKEKIYKYNKHQELYSDYTLNKVIELMDYTEEDKKRIKENAKKYKDIFEKNDKWYCKPLTAAIKEMFEQGDTILSALYRYLCLHTHGNLSNYKEKNTKDVFSIAPAYGVILNYQFLYKYYISVFSDCTKISCCVKEHEALFEKIKSIDIEKL